MLTEQTRNKSLLLPYDGYIDTHDWLGLCFRSAARELFLPPPASIAEAGAPVEQAHVQTPAYRLGMVEISDKYELRVRHFIREYY